jgi:hypothetical protein
MAATKCSAIKSQAGFWLDETQSTPGLVCSFARVALVPLYFKACILLHTPI